MIFKSSDKAVNPKGGIFEIIRNAEKTIQNFTVTKTIFRVNDRRSVLGLWVTSVCAGFSFRPKKTKFMRQNFHTSISHTTSKWKPNYKIFCHMLLIQDKVNNTSPYLELLRNSRTRSEFQSQSVLTEPIHRALSLHEPKVCDFPSRLLEEFGPTPKVKLVLNFQKQQQLK
jgi:hypothetical protein